MAWKKIVVSGSAAELSNINVTNAVTASYFAGDGSGLVNIVASGTISSSAQIASDISGAFGADSASFSTRIAAQEAFSSSLDGTFATEEELNAATSSLKTVLTTTDQIFSGSFSGSYVGDGSQLSNITVDQNATVSSTFTSATTASVVHNFNSPNVTAVIYDSNNEQFIPATVKLVSDNQLDVYMDPAQTGRVIAIRGGHIVSGSIPFENIIALPSLVSSSAQIAEDISGSFTDTSASLASSITTNSASLASSITTVDTRLTNVSSSFATTISGLSQTLTVSGSDGTGGQTDLLTQAVTFTGAANEVNTTVSGQTVTIGLVDNPTISGNLTIAGNLSVTGDTIQAQVTNINVEDRFILLNSGSTTGDAGIIFGGSDGSANQGSGIFWDSPANIFGFAQSIGAEDTTATHTSKLGNIQVASSNPSTAPTFQGVGTVHVNDSDEGIWIYS